MKLDITKLPVIEGTIAFFIVVIIVTFIGAFSATGGGAEDEATSGSPPPRETPQDGGTPAPTGDASGPIEVVMQDNTFDPDEITVPAGTSVTFTLTNEGSAIHNMHIAGRTVNTPKTSARAAETPAPIRSACAEERPRR